MENVDYGTQIKSGLPEIDDNGINTLHNIVHTSMSTIVNTRGNSKSNPISPRRN